MAKLHTPKSVQQFPLTVAKQMTQLATSGFSLVAALAWNDLIRNIIDVYVKPYFGKNSGLIASLLYAVIITIITVAITLQLTSIQQRLEPKEEEEKN